MVRQLGGRWWTRLLLFAVVLLPAIYWLYQRHTHVYTDDARIAADMIDVRSKVAGWMVQLPVSSGDYVARLQPLAILDSREVSLQLEELQSELAARKAEQQREEYQLIMVRQQSGGNIEAVRSDLKAAMANKSATQSDLEFHTNELERAKSLREQKLISQKDWEQKRLAVQQTDQQYKRAVAAVDSAGARLVEAEASGGRSLVLEQDIARIKHHVRSLELKIKQKQIEQKDHDVLAPRKGIIDKLFVDTGEYVAKGQRLLLMHNPDEIWIDVNIKETEIDRLRVGQHVSVKVDAYPNEKFEGRVQKIGHAVTSQFALLPTANPSGNFTKITQRLNVKVAIEQLEGLLKPGMMVRIAIDVR